MGLKIGVVGCGNFANAVHFPSFAELDDVELVAVCDRDESRMKEAADKYGPRAAYTDYNKMLAEQELDGVHVLVWPKHLKTIALELIGAGQNVFVEKPPGMDLGECEEMAAAAEKAGVLTMCGFNRRFAPLTLEAKRRVEERGSLTHAVATFHKYMTKPYDDDIPHSILRYDVMHHVDFLCWLGGGEPVELHSHVARDGGEGFSTRHVALMRFEGGMTAFLNSSFHSGARVEKFEMHARGAHAEVEPQTEATVWVEGAEPVKIAIGDVADGSVMYRRAGYLQENAYWLECLAEKREPHCSLRNCLPAMRTVEKMIAAEKRA